MTHAHAHETGPATRARAVFYTHAHEPVSAENRWWHYVCMISKDASPSEVARVIGTNQSTVHRWRSTSPSVTAVRAVARSYDRPVLEAFVAAGFLTEAEISGVVGEQTSAELQSRTDELRAAVTRIHELAHMIAGPAQQAAETYERAAEPARRAAESAQRAVKAMGGNEK